MSRKRSQPPISLFSFQDIITAVTAIMIVIVICLTLELLDRTTASAETVATVAVEELRLAVNALQTQLQAFELQEASDPSMLAEAAAVTPNALASQITELEHLLVDAKAALNQERTRAEQLQQESAKVDAQRFNARAELSELEQLDERVRHTQSRLQSLQNTKRPIYAMPRGSTREGWLVVVNANSIEAARIGVTSPPVEFQRTPGLGGTETTAASQCLKWIDTARGTERYFMVVVRPGGAELFQKLEDGLQSRQISYGFDVTSADQPLLDPVVGTGAP
jgi:hypothetical protein